jgi:hypothetical protein
LSYRTGTEYAKWKIDYQNRTWKIDEQGNDYLGYTKVAFQTRREAAKRKTSEKRKVDQTDFIDHSNILAVACEQWWVKCRRQLVKSVNGKSRLVCFSQLLIHSD